MQQLLEQLEKEIDQRQIDSTRIAEILKNEPLITNRRIIYGYASVDVVDREGQRIPVYALREAVDRFMKSPFYRPVMIYHSDVTVGRILPKWTDPDTGKVYKTEVDDRGWKVVCEVRDDLEIVQKVWGEIIKGTLRSFSIAGSSKDKLVREKNGIKYEQVKSLDIYENTICETPVNQLSKFDILWNPKAVEIF